MDGTSSGASSSSDAHRPIPAADHATAVVSKADIGRPSAGVEEPSLATSAPLIGEAARESIPSTAGDQAAPAAKETAATAQPSAQRSTKCSALPPQPGIEPAGTPVTGSRSTPADDLLDSRDSTEGQAARANGTQSVAAAEGEAPSLPSNHVLGGESEAARAAETQSVVHTEGETPSLPSNHGLGGKSEEASRNVSSEGSLSCAPEMAAVAEQGEVPRETDPEGCADVVSSSSLEVSCLGGRATGSSSPGENGPCGNTNDGVTIHGREGSWSPLVSPVAGVDSTPRNACAAASTGSTGEAMGATAECPIYESVVALNSRQHWMYVQVIGPAPIDEKVSTGFVFSMALVLRSTYNHGRVKTPSFFCVPLAFCVGLASVRCTVWFWWTWVAVASKIVFLCGFALGASGGGRKMARVIVGLFMFPPTRVLKVQRA